MKLLACVKSDFLRGGWNPPPPSPEQVQNTPARIGLNNRISGKSLKFQNLGPKSCMEPNIYTRSAKN